MARKYGVSTEEKMLLIQQYKEGKASKEECAKSAGVNLKTFWEWIRRYEVEGAQALLPQEHNRTYNEELKQEAVEAYLSGAGSQTEICEKYHLRSKSRLRAWLKMYNAHGSFNSRNNSGGGKAMQQGRKTTQEERIQIAKECIAGGKNYTEIAQKYKVNYQRVRIWTLRYEAMGDAGLEDRRGKGKRDQTPRTELEAAQIEIEQLKRKLFLAEMENGLLKKLEEIERRDAFHK